MGYAVYGYTATGRAKGFTKDGHTMSVNDIVKDLNRKSYLESQVKQDQPAEAEAWKQPSNSDRMTNCICIAQLQRKLDSQRTFICAVSDLLDHMERRFDALKEGEE